MITGIWRIGLVRHTLDSEQSYAMMSMPGTQDLSTFGKHSCVTHVHEISNSSINSLCWFQNSILRPSRPRRVRPHHFRLQRILAGKFNLQIFTVM